MARTGPGGNCTHLPVPPPEPGGRAPLFVFTRCLQYRRHIIFTSVEDSMTKAMTIAAQTRTAPAACALLSGLLLRLTRP